MASRLPRSDKEIFPGCGHLVNLERPEELYSVVADFLDACFLTPPAAQHPATRSYREQGNPLR